MKEPLDTVSARLESIEQRVYRSTPLTSLATEMQEVYASTIPNTPERARAALLLVGLFDRTDNAKRYEEELRKIATLTADSRIVCEMCQLDGLRAFRSGQFKTATQLFSKALDAAIKDRFYFQEVRANFILGEIAAYYYSFDEAIEFFSASFERASHFEYLRFQLRILSRLGEICNASGRYVEAKQYANDSLDIAQNVALDQDVITAKIRLASIEIELREFENVMAIVSDLQAVVAPDNSPTMCLLHLLPGKVHAAKKEWKPAEKELKTALSLATYPNAERVRSNIHCHLCELYLARKKNELARDEAKAALEDANTSQDVYCKKEALKLLQQCYKALGKFEEAYKYLEEYNALVAESDAALLKSRLEYHALKSDYEQEKAKADMQTQHAELLRIKLEYKERELTEKMRHLITQAEAVRQFRNDLRALLRRTPSDDPAAKDIRTRLSNFSDSDVNWQEFEKEFVTAHPDFAQKIAEKFPMLTKQEIKMCQLARLGLKTHEMARLLCLSERTIDGHRNNLRKKLGLAPSDNLSKFLQGIS